MKSPMVRDAEYISDKGNYSELQVLRSPAGYYVGTLYNAPEGYQEPGSRDSDYFPTRADAEAYLKLTLAFEGAGLRLNP